MLLSTTLLLKTISSMNYQKLFCSPKDLMLLQIKV